jgi:hypothetical protein
MKKLSLKAAILAGLLADLLEGARWRNLFREQPCACERTWTKFLACAAAASLGPRALSFPFEVMLHIEGIRRKYQTLVLDIGPGDTWEPVITTGFPADFLIPPARTRKPGAQGGQSLSSPAYHVICASFQLSSEVKRSTPTKNKRVKPIHIANHKFCQESGNSRTVAKVAATIIAKPVDVIKRILRRTWRSRSCGSPLCILAKRASVSPLPSAL